MKTLKIPKIVPILEVKLMTPIPVKWQIYQMKRSIIKTKKTNQNFKTITMTLNHNPKSPKITKQINPCIPQP